jgi:hypothetical protein
MNRDNRSEGLIVSQSGIGVRLLFLDYLNQPLDLPRFL